METHPIDAYYIGAHDRRAAAPVRVAVKQRGRRPIFKPYIIRSFRDKCVGLFLYAGIGYDARRDGYNFIRMMIYHTTLLLLLLLSLGRYVYLLYDRAQREAVRDILFVGSSITK